MLTRELLRAIRQIVAAVDLAGMDIVEVSPPYDQAETTAMAANRVALEAISALARPARRRPLRPLGGLTIADSPWRPDRATADALARLYDLDLVDDPGDLDLYLALAERTGGPILELAVGTGRLAVPLAEARPPRHRRRPRPGDARPGAPARQRRRPRRRRTGSTLVEADLVGLRLPDAGRFGLAFIAPQLAARPGDRAAPSGRPCRPSPTTSPRAAWPSSTSGCPTPRTWPASTAGSSSSGRALDPETGDDRHEGPARPSTTPRRGRSRLTTIFEEGGQGAPVRRWVRRDRLRLVSADELRGVRRGRRARRRDAGRRLRHGSLGPGSERAILLAVKP